jgi:hypothetical protein
MAFVEELAAVPNVTAMTDKQADAKLNNLNPTAARAFHVIEACGAFGAFTTILDIFGLWNPIFRAPSHRRSNRLV